MNNSLNSALNSEISTLKRHLPMQKRKPTKTGAKPFWYNPVTGQQSLTRQTQRDEYFHSVLEFKLYNQFLAILSPTQIFRQQKILYKPATQEYDELYWTVDFVLKLSGGRRLYVEAKGGWINADSSALSEFQHKLQFLEYVNSAVWRNLYLVSDTKLTIDKKLPMLTPAEFLSTLRSEIYNAAQSNLN